MKVEKFKVLLYLKKSGLDKNSISSSRTALLKIAFTVSSNNTRVKSASLPPPDLI